MSRVLFPPNNNPTERGEIMMDDVVVAHEDGSVDSENKGVINGHDLALADNHDDDEARRVDNEGDMALDDNNGVVEGRDDSGMAVRVPAGGVYESYEDFCGVTQPVVRGSNPKKCIHFLY